LFGGLYFDTLTQEHHHPKETLILNSTLDTHLLLFGVCKNKSCALRKNSKIAVIFKSGSFNWRNIWLPLSLRGRSSEQHDVVVEGRINTLRLRVYAQHSLCGKLVLPWESNICLWCSAAEQIQEDMPACRARSNSEFVMDGISFKSPIFFSAGSESPTHATSTHPGKYELHTVAQTC
jgi:hypothetical protein